MSGSTAVVTFSNVKPASVAVPTDVTTDTLPLAPAPTTALILVGETTEKDVAATPPNDTALTFVKFVPVMVTAIPWVPVVGSNDVIVGKFTGGMKVNPSSDKVLAGNVTVTAPLAPVLTTAVIVVADT